MENLTIYNTPELRSPNLVAAFSGWPDAAHVATGAVVYLRDKLGATRFAEINPWAFYDFSSLRPSVVVENGMIKSLRFHSNDFFFWKNEASDNDLIFFLGTEPNLRWNEYVEAIMEMGQRFHIKRLYMLGGLYDAVPHTREPKISSVVNEHSLKEVLSPLGIEFTNYQGPGGMSGMLFLACRRMNIDAISLWGHAPHYVQTANPKVCFGLLTKLTRLLNIEVDLEDLRRAGEYLDDALNKALSENAELHAYVQRLEREERRPEYRGPQQPSEDLIKEIEEFLKRRQRKKDDEGA